MELHCPPAARLPRPLGKGSPTALGSASFLCGRPLPSRGACNGMRRSPDSSGFGCLFFKPRAVGPAEGVTGSRPQAVGDTKELSISDGKLAFVAGATGRVGSRTVRELLKLGFSVRAGVRSTQRAETLVQSVRQMKLDGACLSASEIQPVERLEIVECNLENPQEIGPAIGGASIVICCIGASEKEVFDITGPYRIDYKASENLIKAATAAKVNHFILVTSLGTNKFGFPASLLNLFWGVLCWKRMAEEALIASGLPYTIVRPGGMERPTDTFKETHNIILADGDTYFGGLVSNLQVAELIAFMANNTSLSFCKVVEVIAETTTPLKPMGELLAKIPSQHLDTSLLKEDKSGPTATSVPPPTVDQVKEEPAQMNVPKTKPLSPYTAYDDLKPPTSPTPTPSSASSGQKETKIDIASSTISGADNGTTIGPSSLENKENVQGQAQRSSYRSPYPMYENFKPPASPSPSAPSTTPAPAEAAVSSPKTSQTSSDQMGSSSDDSAKQHTERVQARPLSPFTMYEDLRPPASPSPSLPKY